MKDVIHLVKANRQFDKDKKAALIRFITTDSDFIAVSTHLKMKCSCGENQEVWSTSRAILSSVEQEFIDTHRRLSHADWHIRYEYA